MSKTVRVHRANLVGINFVTKVIEPSEVYYWFHPECYEKWFNRQARQGGLSYSLAELEIDTDNIKGIDCHSCKRPLYRELIVL